MKTVNKIQHINKGLFTLLATLFIVTILATVYLTKTLLDSRTLITNGTNTISAVLLLQDLELNVRTAESSQRGYLITGDPKHLEPYSKALKIISEEQKALGNRGYAINKSQRDQLSELISERVEMLKTGIEIKNTQGLDGVVAFIGTNKGLETTTHIESLAKTITRSKFQPFTSTYQQTQNSLRNALIVAGLMVGFMFLISGLIASYFQRALSKERATEGVKNEFLSLASHQLRTPASNVKQYLGLLLEGYLGKLKPDQIEALKVASRNNDIGITIINNLLGVAKLDLEKIHLNKKECHIYPLVKEVVDDYRPRLRERKQVAKFEKISKTAEANVDVNYFKSVFENLIDNASKYSPKKSHIYVRVEHTQKKVIISIRDEGVGIKRAEKSKLFKKFSRIPSEFSGDIEGSGLGLYWVKKIVELHGGRISVKSRHNKGSTFIVELPSI